MSEMASPPPVSCAMAKEFLSKAAADNSVSQFLDGLKQVNDVCGHSLSEALHRSWHSLIASYTDSSSSCIQGVINSLGGRTTSVHHEECESGFLWAQVALDFTWSKLNSNHWKDVELIWREAYATAALFKALSLLCAGKVQEALIEIDKGILLGAPVFSDTLKSFASTLTNEVQQTSSKHSCDGDISEANICLLEADCSFGGASTSKLEVGKIVFRNYNTYRKSSSHGMNTTSIRAHPHDSAEGPLCVDSSTIPLIDMTRRIAVVNCPSLEEFYHSHMMSSTPAVISGAVDHWPACTTRKWRYVHVALLYKYQGFIQDF